MHEKKSLTFVKIICKKIIKGEKNIRSEWTISSANKIKLIAIKNAFRFRRVKLFTHFLYFSIRAEAV